MLDVDLTVHHNKHN